MKKSYPTYAQAVGLLLLLIPFSALGIFILMPFHLAEDTFFLSVIYSLSLGLTVYFGLRARKKYSFDFGRVSVSMLLATVVRRLWLVSME